MLTKPPTALTTIVTPGLRHTDPAAVKEAAEVKLTHNFSAVAMPWLAASGGLEIKRYLRVAFAAARVWDVPPRVIVPLLSVSAPDTPVFDTVPATARLPLESIYGAAGRFVLDSTPMNVRLFGLEVRGAAEKAGAASRKRRSVNRYFMA